MRLTRIMADAFGMQRPLSCVVSGHAARLLNTDPHRKAEHGGVQKLAPVQDYIDGMSVIETAPPTAVELFHICLRRHSTIRVGGLEFETYHPGPLAPRVISHPMRSLFFNLFPHADCFGDFGPLAYSRADETARPTGEAMIA